MCLRLVVLAAPPIVVSVVSCSCCCYVSYAVLSFVTHAHTHRASEAAGCRQRTADSRESSVASFGYGLPRRYAELPGLSRTVTYTWAHASVYLCVWVCVTPRGSCMQSHVCCFLVASFCRHFARWLAAIFIARQLWTSSVLQMISIPGWGFWLLGFSAQHLTGFPCSLQVLPFPQSTKPNT